MSFVEGRLRVPLNMCVVSIRLVLDLVSDRARPA